MSKTQSRGAVDGPKLGLGASASYKSTNVQFRGQDKVPGHIIGYNPNVEPDDEYIANLQQ